MHARVKVAGVGVKLRGWDRVKIRMQGPGGR